jgi:hypothetical protein
MKVDMSRIHRLGAAGIAAVTGFARWWLSELDDILKPLSHWWQRPYIEARFDEDRIELAVRPPTSKIRLPVGFLDLDEHRPVAPLPQLPNHMAVRIIPPSHDVLSRELVLPRAVAAKCEALFALEAERWTAFPAAEIVHGWTVPQTVDDHRVRIELRFVAKSRVSHFVEILEGYGLRASAIVLDEITGLRVPWKSDPVQCVGFMDRRWIALTFGCCLTFAIADWFVATHEQRMWQRRVETETGLLKHQNELESQIVSIKASSVAAQAKKLQLRSTLVAAIADALPPTDWLTEVSIKQSAVTLRGYCTNIEALIKLLEPLSADRAVAMQGELVFDANLGRQRFTVMFHTEGTKS